MGSKNRIAKHIVPIIQKCIDDNDVKYYYEPFVGGANVIDKIKCENRIGSDLNKYLIGLLNHVKCGEELLPQVTRELYSEVRDKYKNGDYEDWYVGNIGFLASYNGRWFDGGYAKSGYEKTKNGVRYRDYYQEAKRNLESQYDSIKDVEFVVSDYKSSQFKAQSVIYCDPPYANTKQFLNAVNFNYDEFWGIVREWSKEHYVFVSELNAPNDFECIWTGSVSRSIKVNDKNVAVEKLFTYKENK